jgi:hypothetical protein
MSFLYPAFLLGALAVALPIVLHLLRRDIAPEVPFTAVRLLRRAPIERSKRRRLREIVLLAARVAALLLLAAAFARPYTASSAFGSLRIVAVDRSFSMGGAGRFERALSHARAAIDAGRVGEQVALVAFDTRADVVAEPGSAGDAREALAGLTTGFGATAVGALGERVSSLARGMGGTLVVISDLQRSGWENQQPIALPAGWSVEVVDVGAIEGNVALTSVAMEPDRVVASLRNDWNASREGRVRVLHNDREIATAPYSMEPDTNVDIPLAVRTPTSGAFTIAIDDPGGLPADDVRYRIVGGDAQSRALLVTGTAGSGRSGFYLSRALDAPSEDGGFAVDVRPASGLPAALFAEPSQYAIVVLTSTRGLERRAREALATHVRAGGGLLITAAADQDAAMLSNLFGWQPALSPVEMSERPLTFAATDPRHPVFRPFGPLLANLGNVRFDRVWRVRADGWTVIARFDDGSPALLERREGSGRVLLFASDLDRRWNDFPVHPSFVPFAIETARFASAARVSTRELTVGAIPAGLEPKPGIQQAGTRQLAVNVDPRESNLTRMQADEFASRFQPSSAPAPQATRLQARQLEADQSIWRYGLMLMLLVLVGESFVGRVK